MANRRKIRGRWYSIGEDAPAAGDYVFYYDRGWRGGFIDRVHNGRKHRYVVIAPMKLKIGRKNHVIRPKKKVELRAIREICRR